jgi:hypothetical protein
VHYLRIFLSRRHCSCGSEERAQINVVTPPFFSAINKVLPATSMQQLAAYLRWQVIHAAAPLLSVQFFSANFDFFQRILEGVEQPPPREYFSLFLSLYMLFTYRFVYLSFFSAPTTSQLIARLLLY